MGEKHLWEQQSVSMEEEEIEMSSRELRKFIQSKVVGKKILPHDLRQRYKALCSLLERRRKMAADLRRLQKSLLACEAVVRQQYLYLGWEYTDSDDDNDNRGNGEMHPPSCEPVQPEPVQPEPVQPEPQNPPPSHPNGCITRSLKRKRKSPTEKWKESSARAEVMDRTEECASPDPGMEYCADEDKDYVPSGSGSYSDSGSSDPDFDVTHWASKRKKKRVSGFNLTIKRCTENNRVKAAAPEVKKDGGMEVNVGKVSTPNGDLGKVSTSSGGVEGKGGKVSTPSGGAEGNVGKVSTPSGSAEGNVGKVSTPSGGAEGNVGKVSTPSGGVEGNVGKISIPNGDVGKVSTPSESVEGNVGKVSTAKGGVGGKLSTPSGSVGKVSTPRTNTKATVALLPPEKLRKPEPVVDLSVNMAVVAKKRIATWQPGTVEEIITKENLKLKYRVKFEDKEKILSAHHIAPDVAPKPVNLTVGTRVVVKHTIGKREYHAGILAETPCRENRIRFMVFLDDGIPIYISMACIRPLSKQLADNLGDITHSEHRKFMEDFLKGSPACSRKYFTIGPTSIMCSGAMEDCNVVKIDSSLIYVEYKDKSSEWIYRGSERLKEALNLRQKREAQKGKIWCPTPTRDKQK